MFGLREHLRNRGTAAKCVYTVSVLPDQVPSHRGEFKHCAKDAFVAVFKTCMCLVNRYNSQAEKRSVCSTSTVPTRLLTPGVEPAVLCAAFATPGASSRRGPNVKQDSHVSFGGGDKLATNFVAILAISTASVQHFRF